MMVTDFDECESQSNDCDVNADCQNTAGSYTCMCKAGYTGDGKTCKGMIKDEAKIQKQIKNLQ